MSIGSVIKKRLLFFTFSFIFIVLLTISSTYAFINSDFVNKGKVINKDNLSIIYESGESVLNCSYPLSFQQGNSLSPSNIIKIVNKGHFSTKYSLIINELKSGNSISLNKIYFTVNGSEPKLLSQIDNRVIYTSNVDGKMEDILDVKIWVSEEYIENSDQGKSVNIEFDVINE